MSWGTVFNADIFLIRRVFSNQEQLSDAVAEVKGGLQTNREIILMAAMSNPKDLVETDEDVLYATRNRINDIIDDIIDRQRELTLLETYQEAINDGKAKFHE